MESAQGFVETTISSKPVVVFSKTYCPFCVKVKELFQNDIKVPADKIAVVEIESMPDCAAIQAVLKEKTGASSVPRVFVSGKSIGGCDDTTRLHQNGELKKLLDEALA